VQNLIYNYTIIFKIFWSKNLKERDHLEDPGKEYSTDLNLSKEGGSDGFI